MAAHLIPTVERESIDFVDPTLNTWNQEMLAMGGLVARILCEDDLDSTARLYTELKLDAISESWLQNKAIHNLKGFTFQNSTPISLVGRLISTSFYKYSTRPVRLVSSKGILPCTQVRLRDPEMSEFLKTLPVVPEAVEAQCQELLKRLKDLYAVRLPNLDDVFVELSSRTFSVDQTVALFRWWIQQWRQGKVKTVDSQRLKNNLLITDSKSAPQTMQNVVYYTQPKLVPADLPLPNSVLPLEISKFFINPELEQALW